MKPTWTLASLAAVMGVLIVAAAVLRPASASQLDVSSVPLQTWRLENAAPVLPGIDRPAPEARQHATKGVGEKQTTAPAPDQQPEEPAGPGTPTDEATSEGSPSVPSGDDASTTDPIGPAESDPTATPEASEPTPDSSPTPPPVDLSTCGDLGQYDEVVYGTAGDDTLTAGAGRQVLVGLGGDDVLTGGDGDDCLLGGAGDDALIGEPTEDELDGGSGTDLAAPTEDALTDPVEDLITAID